MPRLGPSPRPPLESRPRLALGGICLGLGLSACAPELPTPSLRAVDPEYGYAGEDMPIHIFGEGFYPAMGARVGADVEWDREVQAWLLDRDGVEHRLSGVSLSSYEEIEATVPEGLEPGLYDLRVQTPGGDEADLPGAYEVTSTKVASLSLLIQRPSLDIGEYAELEVRALDEDGAPVEEALPITVELTLDQDEVAIDFADSPALEDQVELSDVVGIQGTLEPTGVGYFALTADAEANVTVSVSATDTDSRVRSDIDTLSFNPGPVSKVAIYLSSTEVVAGEDLEVTLELQDEDGNPASSTQALLYVHESCPGGTYGESLFLIGSETVQVAVTGATNQSCEANTLQVAGVAEGQTFEGESEPFQVSPAEPSKLGVLASPSTVTVGEGALNVVVTAQDEFGNVVEDHAATLTLEDSVGGLDPAGGVGVQVCTEMGEGLALAFCEVWPWRAGAGVTITANDGGRLWGESNPIDIAPGKLAGIVAEMEDTTLTAGESFVVTVVAQDSSENIIDAEPESYGAIAFQDDYGDVSCSRSEADLDTSDGADFDCVLTIADGANALVVTLTSPDATFSDWSPAFAVVNGELAEVEIDIGDTEALVAGESLEAAIKGYDAWGNLYTDGAARTVELWDDSGGMALTTGGTSLSLDADGCVTVQLEFTASQEENRVYGGVGDTLMGASAPFDVDPADLAEITVRPEATWAWVGEPLAVRIKALDAYGNLVTNYDAPVTLRSEGLLGLEVSSEDWQGGVLDLEFTYADSGLGDTLTLAQGGEDVAVSDTIDALDADCGDGPEAALAVAGDSPATLCLSGDSTALTTVSAGESEAGAAALAWYHFDLGDGDWSRSADEAVSTRWTGEGGYRVRVVVADEDACGAATSAEVYVAESDGRAAGPVTVSLDDDTLNAGLDAASVAIEALDCAGDPAEGALYAWADLGRVESGATSAITDTGAGLSVDLSRGEADLSWSMVSAIYDGVATLHIGTPTGAAYGSVSATVTGDAARPHVLSMSPAGTWTEPIDEIVLELSEPIDEDSIDRKPTSLVLETLEPVSVAGLSLSASRTTLTITLGEEVTPGELSLTVPAELRDDAGNRLNGAWDDGGSPSDFSLDFGDVENSAPDVSGCEPELTVFRPDGSVGSDEESESVTVNVVAGERPAWWRLTVTDSDGVLVFLDRVAADTAGDPLSWSGRSLDGFVVDAGTYNLETTAEDAFWNTGATCSTTVTVAHRITALP